MRIIIFAATDTETLEKEINEWLEREREVVVHVLQSEAENWITITIFYK